MSEEDKMRLIRVLLFLILALGVIGGCSDSNQNAGTEIVTEIVLVNAFPEYQFNKPIGIENAGDNRLFVLEHRGVIKVINSEGVQGFLNIEDRVLFNDGELGALGLAFHPDYESNGYLYINYIADNPLRNVISRFQVTENPDLADPESEVVIMEINQPHPFHNGGQLVFGPDGYLYISSGDGGPAGGTNGTGQDLTTLFGAVLRIDVDTSTELGEYGIPDDNPFVDVDGVRPEIYAYGLRNPWRMSFDPETGYLFTGDVGEAKVEEIDILEKGQNYGWDIKEGTFCFNGPCDTDGLTEPIYEYGRGLGRSITGGYVYRGMQMPSVVGKYIYGDFISGRIWALELDGKMVIGNKQLLRIAEEDSFILVSFGLDNEGEIYIAGFDGNIYKLVELEL